MQAEEAEDLAEVSNGGVVLVTTECSHNTKEKLKETNKTCFISSTDVETRYKCIFLEMWNFLIKRKSGVPPVGPDST